MYYLKLQVVYSKIPAQGDFSSKSSRKLDLTLVIEYLERKYWIIYIKIVEEFNIVQKKDHDQSEVRLVKCRSRGRGMGRKGCKAGWRNLGRKCLDWQVTGTSSTSPGTSSWFLHVLEHPGSGEQSGWGRLRFMPTLCCCEGSRIVIGTFLILETYIFISFTERWRWSFKN